MKRVKVISKKFDGSLRDEYETALYLESDEAYFLYSEPGVPYYDYRKAGFFTAQDGLIEIYFKNRWYNVRHIAEQVSGINRIYVNIALPATLLGEILEWVDLDLDYRLYLDGTYERLDQAEFEHNRQRYGYPADLVEQALAACREVEAGLTNRTFPFDHQRQVEFYWNIKGK